MNRTARINAIRSEMATALRAGKMDTYRDLLESLGILLRG